VFIMTEAGLLLSLDVIVTEELQEKWQMQWAPHNSARHWLTE